MDLSLPYLAGFFDGEGSVGIYTNGRKDGRTLRSQVTQNVSPAVTSLLEACRERWGGSLTVMNRDMKRQAYNWQTSGPKAAIFLREIRPWVILKAEQIDLAVSWQEGRVVLPRGVSRAPEEIAEADLVAARLMAMKKL